MEQLKELILSAVRERWSTRTGLVLSLVFTAAVLVATFAQLDLADVSTLEWVVTALILAAVFGLWWRTKLPRVKKSKVGFGVAILYEDASHAQQIKADLVAVVRELISDARLQQRFEFVEFDQNIARLLVEKPQETGRIARQSNIRYLLWGRARFRTTPQGPSHIIDLHGFVTHGRIAVEQSRAFGQDMSQVLPSRLVLGAQTDPFAFEFIARHLDAAARYIIGTAAALSGEREQAEELLLDAEQKLKVYVSRAEGSLAAAMLARVRTRLGELYQGWLNALVAEHVATRTREVLIQQERLVAKLKVYRPDSYNAHLSAAMTAFVLRRDIAEARREIEACASSDDAIWRYGEAFLHAYEGDLQSAYRSYRKAFESPLADITVPTQCEEFIQTVLEEEPDRYWLYFCLGLINYRAKGDLAAARLDFERFLARAEPARYETQIEAVRIWIAEIDQLLAA